MVFIVGTPNSDFLTGTAGNDTILGLAGNDTVLGQDGNDQLFGFENNDILYGNRGNDTLRGGQDNDQLYGGKDNDQLYGDKGNDTVSGDTGSDTIFGLDDNDLLFGGQQDDVIFGNKGNDTIRGGKDNDLLRGGRDNDQLYGDLGNDSLYGDLDNDFLFGSDGNDFLSGNQGNDTINGNMGNDTAYGGQGNDLVRGGMQNDSLFGDKGNDTLYGDLGDDTIYGGEDADLIFGDQGGESKFGGTGNDVLFGNQGNDTIFGLGGNDILYGNQGDDLLLGSMAKDTLYGGQEDDTLRGGMQNDVLFGDKGRDVLYGDLGADTLRGDVAGDTISDIFVIGRVSGITGATTKTTGGPNREDADVITDFQACTDLISLTGGLVYDNLNIFQGTGADAANTIIQDKGTGEFLVVLQGFSRDNIDGTSFIPAGPPDVRILATDPLATEPSIGSPIDTGEFTISVPCTVEKALPISYTISGTATNGKDYNPLSGVVIIPAGSDTVTIPIIPLGDTLTGEGNESVTLTLVDLPGYNLQTPLTATVNIADGPVVLPGTKPIVFVTAPDPLAGGPAPSAGNGTFQFARTGGDLSQPVTIRYTVGGSALENSFSASPSLSGTITIPAGQAVSNLITISPQGGGAPPTQTVTVAVAEDAAYIVGSQPSATVSLLGIPLAPPPATTGIFLYNSDGQLAVPTPFNSIAQAIAAATANSNQIIFVSAGTYNESVTINKSGLIIRGPNAGNNPNGGSSVTPAIVQPTAAGQPVFTIADGTNNVTIEGLTIQTNGENGIRMQANTGGENIVIRRNVFTGPGSGNSGAIYMDLNPASSVVSVRENALRDITNGTTSAIQIIDARTVTILDNVLSNVAGPGMALDNITGTDAQISRISNNSVSDIGEQGIQLAGGSANITNNDVTNANRGQDRIPNSGDEDPEAGGIRVRNSGIAGGGPQTVNILSNVITNSLNGVAIRSGTTVPTTVQVNFNNLIGNTAAGLRHSGTGALNAENNWWSDPAGPVLNQTGPRGITGVSAGLVDFDPFSATPF
ncbi:MAG TPA: hypothetical protein DCY88_06890 [Cyanobacteria bacterium UBA11372]|nr:hypothetical protein [Cyanobacteria bacterium UBA11372]